VRDELEATSTRITALDESAAVARPQLRARLVEIYKLGRARYVRLLLATPTCNVSARRRELWRHCRPSIDSASSPFSDARRVTAARTSLQEREQHLAALRAAAERAQAAAMAATAARNNLVRDIDRRAI
jgi:hypothetical protein